MTLWVVFAVLSLTAIGFVTIITAAITSTFVEASQRRLNAADRAEEQRADDRIEDRLAEIADRLERIERRLDGTSPTIDDDQHRPGRRPGG